MVAINSSQNNAFENQSNNQKHQSNAESLTGEESSINQYVTFFINDESFAFPMEGVREIVRMPESVQVPLTSSSLIGLANLRGSVLPILDLRRLLQVDEKAISDATRVVVAECHGKGVGLIVDRVSRVISVEKTAIEDSNAIRTSINADMLMGVVKNVEGHALIQLLNAEQIVSHEFSSMNASVQVSENGNQANKTTLQDESDDDDAKQLVSFIVDEQEYAFHIQQVEEIVRLPDDISRVPNTDSHVLGIINLRDSLLPLVNLRTMFHLAEAKLDENHRILVVNINDAKGRKVHSVGIVVDNVKEVIRITADAIDDVPSMLNKNADMSEIVGICRLDDGKRLVSVLSSDMLFDDESLQKAFAETLKDSKNEESDMQAEKFHDDLDDNDETQLVVFQLAGQEFGIVIESVQEITRVPEEMNKVPKTADFIEGMINLRGSVLPVMDMRVRFGIERMNRSERQRILVLDLNGTKTGFITDAVAEVIRLSRDRIEDAPSLSEEQEKMIGKVVNLKEQQRVIQVLDAMQLLDQSELKEIANIA